jgi:hypothetical protein
MADSSRPAAEPARPVVSETRARQGRVGTGLIWVLVFGTLLAAIALLVAWTWKAPSLASANSGTGHVSGPPAFNAPEPAAIVPPQGADHTAPQPH